MRPPQSISKVLRSARFDPEIASRVIATSLALLLLAAPLSANSVVSWGRQVIPPPDELNLLVDVSAGDGFNVALKSGGEVIVWGSNNYRQANVPDDLGAVIAVAAGSSHVLALRGDGSVAAWGNARDNQTAVPKNLDNVVAIGAGGEHSLALHDDGSVTAWGSNRFQQTEVPDNLGDITAISAGLYHNLALRTDGTVVAWGLNGDGQATVPEDLTDVIAVAAGGFHSLALRRDGTVVGWGNNDFAQASLPDGITAIDQIHAGQNHNLVLLKDGSIAAWGRNHYGQVTAPTDLPRGRRISAGADHSLALAEDGSFAAWGKNDSGQSLNARDLASVIAISAWDNHTVALRRDGTVFWWGANLSMGIQPDHRALQNVVAVAAGRAHGLALRANGTVVGWGDNLYGQASPPSDLRNVVAIAAGEFHSLALRGDGTVAAWGNNFHSQVNVPRGLSKVIAIAGGQEHSVALNQGGMVFGWGNDFHGQRRVPASLNKVVDLATGSLHNLALRSNGTLMGWGSNLFGQSSVPNGLSDVVAMSASRSHSVAIRENRTVIGWGSNHHGQSQVPPNLGPAVDVAAGNGRTVVVTGDLRPPRFVSRFQQMLIPAGEDIFLLPLTEGTPPMLYQWMKDGEPIPGAISPALSLSNVGALDSGTYSLIMANRAGNTTGESFSIEVEDPSVTIEVNPRVAVLETTATFTAWAQGRQPFRYQWLKDGEPIPGAQEMSLVLQSVHEDHTGMYSVEVSNEFSTTVSERVQFLVEPRIETHPPETTVARIGERLTLQVAASGSPPLETQWLREGLPIEGATKPALVLENIRVSDGGVYSAVISNPAGRVMSGSTLLQISPHIIFQPESQVFSAFGGTAVFEVRATGTPPLTYHWMKDRQLVVRTPEPRLVLDRVQASDAGEYHVVVVSPAGQLESERASLVVPPEITNHPQSESVRAGESVEFTVRAAGSQPFEYQWFKNGEPIEGEMQPTLQLSHVKGSDSARYSVVVSNEVGSATSQAGMLSISPNIVEPPQAAVAAPGSEIILIVEAEGSQPLFYQWTKDGAILPDARGPALTLAGVRSEDAGLYSVIVSNAAGIAISEHIPVEVR